jgi:hypothetical protein
MRDRYYCPVSDINSEVNTIEYECNRISCDFDTETDGIQSAISSIVSIDAELRSELIRMDESIGHVQTNILELYDIIKQLRETISDYDENYVLRS